LSEIRIPSRFFPGAPSLPTGLADPLVPVPDPVISGDLSRFVEALERMVLIRLAEVRIGEMVERGVIKCPCHLAIGQEAPAVGVAMHLRSTDRAFGSHRSHGHYLAVGGSLHRLFAEVLGRDTGASRGMGGSMHLQAREHGFVASVPIVAATIPIAVGAGLAARMDGTGDIAIAFFGDGATEEGAFHESMNLAMMLRAPVLFVCENNLFASHLHIGLRQPADSLVRFAEAHGVPSARVDGNDIAQVTDAVGRVLPGMRAGGGPFFLECVTYRWRGHVGHREDDDVGVKRSEDLGHWKLRDPITRLARALLAAKSLPPGGLEGIFAGTQILVDEAWSAAERDPFPAEDRLVQRTYAERNG